MKVAILVPALSDRDAIGTDALQMGAALQRLGYQVKLFAAVNGGGLPEVGAPETIDAFIAAPEDVLIYHFAFGWPQGVEILSRVRCRRIVRYHNVTPPEFFSGWSDEYGTAAQRGREEIRALAEIGCELYLGDSPFNVEDLLTAGVPPERTSVLPPFNRLDRLVTAPADIGVLDEFTGRSAKWLAVGRVAPNKGHVDLLRAFAVYLDRCEADAQLLIAGSHDPRLARYADALREQTRALDLVPHVRFLGAVSDEALKALFLVADALVSLSGHEGFCVPLAEAMALGTPVVALDRGAQAWTLGGAGLVWPDAQPAIVAASVERIRNDAQLRTALRERGFERVARTFSPAVLERELASVMTRLA